MKDIDGILDFLEEYHLLRPPGFEQSDDRVGRVSDEDEALEVDWETVVTGDFDPGLDVSPEVEDAIVPSFEDNAFIPGLGLGRDADELRLLGERATPKIWESCAWYSPMQQYGPDWGIYIRQECITELAYEISYFAWDSPPTPETARQLRTAAFFVLFLHEQFHHKLEGFGIRLALADRSMPDHWHRYDTAVYLPTLGTDMNLEEALANADAYHRLGTLPYSRVLQPKIRAATRRWLRWRFDHVDPPGYRMARYYLSKASLDAGAEVLQTQVLEASTTPISNPAHWRAGPHLLRSIFPITADIYLVFPKGSAPTFPTTGKPFTVPVREVERWLVRHGAFRELPGRGKGDHRRYERHDGLQVGLDGGARELSRTIERSIAKSLGVSQREFRTAVAEGRPL